MNSRERPIYILGRRWFRRLVPGRGKRAAALLSFLPSESLRGHLVARLASEEAGNLYAFFDSPLDLFETTERFAESHRCFFEVIFPFAQKPHFDIDISDCDLAQEKRRERGERLVAELSVEVERKLEAMGRRGNLLLFSSHSEKKASWHLVVDGVCHADNEEARLFFEAVTANLSPLRSYVDPKVYSSKQCFRLLGSHKPGGPPKIPVGGRAEEGEKSGLLRQLESSLVSWTVGCLPLPSLRSSLPLLPFSPPEDIPLERARAALQLLAARAGVSIDDPAFPHRISSIRGRLVSLKRVAPSHCPICARVHEHENSFLVVGDQLVSWYCFRAPRGRRLTLRSEAPDFPPPEEEKSEGEFDFGVYSPSLPGEEKALRLARQAVAREKKVRSALGTALGALREGRWEAGAPPADNSPLH